MKTSALEYLNKIDMELFVKLRSVYGHHSQGWFLDHINELAPEHQTEIKSLENQWTLYHINQREINNAIELQRREKELKNGGVK